MPHIGGLRDDVKRDITTIVFGQTLTIPDGSPIPTAPPSPSPSPAPATPAPTPTPSSSNLAMTNSPSIMTTTRSTLVSAAPQSSPVSSSPTTTETRPVITSASGVDVNKARVGGIVGLLVGLALIIIIAALCFRRLRVKTERGQVSEPSFGTPTVYTARTGRSHRSRHSDRSRNNNKSQTRSKSSNQNHTDTYITSPTSTVNIRAEKRSPSSVVSPISFDRAEKGLPLSANTDRINSSDETTVDHAERQPQAPTTRRLSRERPIQRSANARRASLDPTERPLQGLVISSGISVDRTERLQGPVTSGRVSIDHAERPLQTSPIGSRSSPERADRSLPTTTINDLVTTIRSEGPTTKTTINDHGSMDRTDRSLSPENSHISHIVPDPAEFVEPMETYFRSTEFSPVNGNISAAQINPPRSYSPIFSDDSSRNWRTHPYRMQQSPFQ